MGGGGGDVRSKMKSPFYSSLGKMVSIVSTLLFIYLPCTMAQNQSLSVSEMEFNLLVDENKLFRIIQVGEWNESTVVNLIAQHPDIVQLVPSWVELPASPAPDPAATHTYDVCALGKSPGHSHLTFNVTPDRFPDIEKLVVRITVMYSNELHILSIIMGWIYFVAWSVSFYPQVWINYKRKSVIGLNFDFLALNLVGFTMYSLFNCGLYFSKLIQNEYQTLHPTGLNPVQLNDVFFSLHAAFATIVTIAQCFLYERGDQSVSRVGRGILCVFGGVVIVSGSFSMAGKLSWLNFLYYCSYIKLCITLIKYIPQAYMNYVRKSTVGWSIGNIFLDFVGGLLSVLQMLLNAYNYNDWHSIFGDITKFGLGFFSLAFDVFFMLQHYVFYRDRGHFHMVESQDSFLKSMGNDSYEENVNCFMSWKKSSEKQEKSVAEVPA